MIEGLPCKYAIFFRMLTDVVLHSVYTIDLLHTNIHSTFYIFMGIVILLVLGGGHLRIGFLLIS